MTINQSAPAGITQLRRKARQGTLDPVARHVLDRVAPGWDTPALDTRWANSLTDLVSWVAAHDGRFPRMKGSDRDAAERASGDWLRTQKQKRDLAPGRARELELRAPGWNITVAGQWKVSKAEAIAWATTNGRIPKFGAEDPDERRVAASMRAWQKAPATPGNDARRTELDRDFPGWRQTRAQVFRSIATDYAAWSAANDSIPAVRKSADADERRLAAWLNNARDRWLRNVLDPGSVAVLDELVSDWRLTLAERRAGR
jgi:hypothetical protein